MKNVIHIVGARPNFMKAAPVRAALAEFGGGDMFSQRLVHTGQHYAADMSDIFFRQLGLPAPDINLEVGSGSHARQTAEIMVRLEELLQTDVPDLVIVYGDVNSTLAATLVCAKLLIPVAHVEAGLRSGDRRMPEEVNRVVTDRLADLLLTPSPDADGNLIREGIAREKIHFVGNVMIDTLIRLLPRAEEVWTSLAASLNLSPNDYALATLHRPSNVDDPAGLRRIISALDRIARDVRVIFPVHPRTRRRLIESELSIDDERLRFVEPVGYVEFLALQKHACFVVTDSGGIQEETTYLGVPCLTLRDTTERPVTVTTGTNILVGTNPDHLHAEVERILAGAAKRGRRPELWDGRASERIAAVLAK